MTDIQLVIKYRDITKYTVEAGRTVTSGDGKNKSLTSLLLISKKKGNNPLAIGQM